MFIEREEILPINRRWALRRLLSDHGANGEGPDQIAGRMRHRARDCFDLRAVRQAACNRVDYEMTKLGRLRAFTTCRGQLRSGLRAVGA